ncbi:MAG TPA: endonuclease MutS2 [Nitrospirota bacterium]
MNEHTLRVLEYDKVKNIVAAYAASEAGRAAIMVLQPTADVQTVKTWLRETHEFIQILQAGERPPLDGILDVGQAVKKLGVSGSLLSASELLNIATTLGVGRRVKSFFQKFEGKVKGASLAAPLLSARATAIHSLKQIEDAVLNAINDNAEVKDSASSALRKIRKQITRMREDILDRMSGILQNSGYQKVIQEPVITIRDDRYVLPLKPNFRQSLKGVVHGQSGSRATLFVEPLDVLEQNNRLAELRMEEREEVERLLRELTLLMAQEVDRIELTIHTLALIDAVYAKARFCMDYDGTIPEISADGTIRLRTARHPLLVGKSKAGAPYTDITPNDIVLDGEKRVLILSGPNAGGKTVILKTIGILCLMAQSGLPVTAAEGSEIPCFGSVFADIGDEQSLEQDLSTFSSHVSQIAEILRQAKKGSLVLMDELGSGTDPGEGAGLGAAVLESLIERGCITVVTTHHNALKLFGSQTSGAVNAAMEFDPATLKPTYRLIPGRPGRSYGLDMAARLGVPEVVIKKARARLGQDDFRLEKLLAQVENDSRLLASERQALEKELAAVQQERAEVTEVLRNARVEARDVKSKAKTEAKEILTLLRQKLRDLSRIAAPEHVDAKKISAEVESFGKRLDPDASAEPRVNSEFVRAIRVGDSVRIAILNKTGTVISLHRGMLELEVDGKKIRLSTAEVMPAESEPLHHHAASTPGWGAELHEDEGAVDRLNIIGLRVDEGLAEVDRFIDRSGFNHLSVVTIIHGLGTGALKAAVTDFLKKHPLIASIRSGEPAEGGAGVTVAEMKK